MSVILIEVVYNMDTSLFYCKLGIRSGTKPIVRYHDPIEVRA